MALCNCGRSAGFRAAHSRLTLVLCAVTSAVNVFNGPFRTFQNRYIKICTMYCMRNNVCAFPNLCKHIGRINIARPLGFRSEMSMSAK